MLRLSTSTPRRGAGPRAVPRVATCLQLAVVLLATGCGDPSMSGAATPATGEAERAVQELERLAFVAAGRTALDSPIDVGSSVDLLVDRYEVTVRLWRQLLPDNDPVPREFRPRLPDNERIYPREWTLDAPVVGLTLREAREAALRRGMRVPTFEEWMWCAVGSRSRRFPAGRNQSGLANVVELGLGRISPVGAFESGQTVDTGIYDLLGNVWEWIEPPLPTASGWRSIDAEGAWPVSGGRTAPTWVMGGSYATPARPIYSPDGTLYAETATLGARSSTVGFRCVVDAAPFLEALGRALPARQLDPEQRRRVAAVGARWGGRSVSALDSISDALPETTVIHLLRDGARQ